MPPRPENELSDDRFLIREGLDALAGYRAIRSDDLRKIVVRLMAATAEAERTGDITDPMRELVLMSNALVDLRR